MEICENLFRQSFMLEKTLKLRETQHLMSVLFVFMSRSQERDLEQTQFAHLIVLLSVHFWKQSSL